MPSFLPSDEPTLNGDCLSLKNIELVDIFSCSPLFPTVAISICTLTAYRQVHRTCPRFSIQAQCKVLCHLHNIPYRSYLNAQFSDAYDIYLEILHRVDVLINQALNRDSLNWRLLNSCPCCFYKLEDEENMALEWLVTMDGNNSLKRWIVDKFKDEVRGHTHPTVDTENGQDIEQTETVPSSSFTCVDRMFSVFDESGIFIAACRHRFILLACDMVKSGELAKYPLAVTLGNSTLGPHASALNFRMMVGVFHGHAHNRRCQIDWHPMYIKGTGHMEGEGCEHIFSSSNELARSTRHTTTFHRHQSIEQHFTFWDEDKYTALSVFIRNHYREALADIQSLTAELSVIWETLNLTDADFIRFHAQEREYLDGLKQAPVKDLVHVDTAYSKLQNTEQLAGYLEVQLGIDKRWEIGGEHYNCFREEALLLRCHSALDELERLVVMRLFELSKLSLSGTGYKLHQHITKALQQRSDAIRNTINCYSTQATALVPPRPKLMWKDIVEYSFLGEFDLLRHSPTVKYFKLQRAREEIQRLNIEIHRLRTAIHDEETKTIATIDQLLITNSLLAMELRRRWQARTAVNAVHLYRLSQIESQPAFSGRRGIGVSATGIDGEHAERLDLTDIISFESNGDVLEEEDQAQMTDDFTSYLLSVGD
ncbi:uncharacterized protein HD556DRAFT_1431731 [Suillus plorans]|uniref:CxC1-like cysteine cluster associated with KDZ transposases domain-containing protein n=1 Tax=Suillus plorans TaxID=116603 RepID=A0A9P7DJ56_9AGAM|nr:uncharacterized protein HD556DRAFT_1431731 [Suillus plorans]KAG1795023.1 hypothetical protein HD556DRAFT_1431731 [Suillus plorans]